MSIAEVKRLARLAAHQGEPLNACPYPKGTDGAKIWTRAYKERLAELTEKAAA
ncbi:hypothetical protein SAMN06265795_12634 [Noviherbaspirillum humi]|uniref:Uncharacterized protein n=1 Tax=Noviherbaspirillum humi TaxID=1688639 RepID=A0A239LTA8_9BURK|nr:hypothetical protein [Noviherbaspirillum humi]SNT33605.1 hypothetical protein SAMN06265795_12634 [Noviherbaspirillum humi]